MYILEQCPFIISAISFEMEKQANGIVEVLPTPMVIAGIISFFSVFIWAISAIVLLVSNIVKKIKNAK